MRGAREREGAIECHPFGRHVDVNEHANELAAGRRRRGFSLGGIKRVPSCGESDES
jgi:hypothetical protein